jgi:hypothetical protein
MHRFRNRRRRSLGIEVLEERRVMAGNVGAIVHFGGHLDLTGDNVANAVEVRGTGIPGEVLITPLQQTTVNGSTSPIVFSGVIGNFSANMNGGNDEIYVKDIAFGGDGRIQGHAGADTIRVGAWVAYGTTGTGDVSFGGKLVVDEQHDSSAADADNIFLGRLTVGTRLDVQGDLGNDFVEIYDLLAYGSVDGVPTLNLRGHDGSDVFNVAYATVYGNMNVSTDSQGTGHDLYSMITSVVHGYAYIDVWHGSNTVALNANQFLLTLEIYSEIGNDSITLTNSFCNKKVTISGFFTENGNDSYTVEGNTISERLYIQSNNGNDTIVVRANQIVTMAIFSGAGYDGVIVRNNIFYGHIDLLGGTEYDVLFLSGNLFYSTYAYYEFESVQP